MSLTLSISDSWENGFNAELIIENKTSKNIYFSIDFLNNNKTKLTWCDNFNILFNKKNKKYNLVLQNWVQPLSSKSKMICKFGGEGQQPLLKYFIIKLLPIPKEFENSSSSSTTNNTNTSNIVDTPLIGLQNSNYALFNVNDIIDLSGNSDKIDCIYVNNKNVASKLSNYKLQIKNIGTCCLKIFFKNKDFRLFGIFVKGFDKNINLIDKTKIGSVSEDDINYSIKFWADFEDDALKSKYCEFRYIYLNNGPGEYGWRLNYSTKEYNLEPLGKRAFTFIRNSLKLGMIPVFVYYNIPDSGESYVGDLEHIQNKQYMTNYFNDLTFLLKLINDETKNGEIPIYLIFEPDFLGYMMQNSGKGLKSPYFKVGNEIQAFVSPVYELNLLNKVSDPTFNDNLEDLVKCINYLCKKFGKNIKNGFQINVWSSSYSGKFIPGQSLMKVTDQLGLEKGKQFIINEAKEIANYYKNCGICYKTDFFSVDKYGLDFRGVNGADLTNAQKSMWGFNSDHWNNYLLYVKTLSDELNLKCILWQMVCGHLNSSQSINIITNQKFKDFDNTPGKYEDSSATFFYGDTFIPKLNSEIEYWKKNEYGQDFVIIIDNKIKWKGMMKDLHKYGIFCYLFGAGVGNSTNSGGLSRPISDDMFCILKTQEYYFS
jgi:hypothetical protein